MKQQPGLISLMESNNATLAFRLSSSIFMIRWVPLCCIFTVQTKNNNLTFLGSSSQREIFLSTSGSQYVKFFFALQTSSRQRAEQDRIVFHIRLHFFLPLDREISLFCYKLDFLDSLKTWNFIHHSQWLLLWIENYISTQINQPKLLTNQRQQV